MVCLKKGWRKIMTLKEIAANCDYEAKKEMDLLGQPIYEHYQLSKIAGKKLATALNANVDIVEIALSLVDIKLGECIQKGKPAENAKASSSFAKKLLTNMGIGKEELVTIINAIEARNGDVAYLSIEAEIVANADCYRYIYPSGVFAFFADLIRSGVDQNSALRRIKAKMDEKYSILSLPKARDELEEYYKMFIDLIKRGKLN